MREANYQMRKERKEKVQNLPLIYVTDKYIARVTFL